jgi:hypothetical protein
LFSRFTGSEGLGLLPLAFPLRFTRRGFINALVALGLGEFRLVGDGVFSFFRLGGMPGVTAAGRA